MSELNYKIIVEEIRMNLQGCDTEQNVHKHATHQQMAFLLMQIHRLVRDRNTEISEG